MRQCQVIPVLYTFFFLFLQSSKMKKILTIVYCTLVGYLSYGQNNPKEYDDLIKKASNFLRSDDYKNAALAYSAAFRIEGSNPTFGDRSNAASSWSLANYPDSVFAQFYLITNLNGFTFSDVHELLTDEDFSPIIKDNRLEDVRNKMFLKAYRTFLTARKEAAGTVVSLKQDSTNFARALALGNKVDSAFMHVNDVAYVFLREKKFDNAYRLFKLSIDQFPSHHILYRNLVDYYLATGDTGKAYSNFARSEETKFNHPDIISNSLFKIDSAIKADYNIFSKKIGYKIPPPGFLMSNFTTSKLYKEVSKQIIDTTFDTAIINPAHSVKQPIVGYDEGHRNAFKVTGRMKKLGELLQNDGYKIIVDTGRFTSSKLLNYDILITGGAIGNLGIETFPQAYTPQEIEAIYNWIVQGGSLLLMTDHPPFDTSVTALVSGLGSKSGVGIVLDSVNSFKPRDKQEFRPGWIIFSKENKGLGNHPILMGRNKTERINRVMTQGGSSITGPTGSINILSFSKSAENQMHRTFIGPTLIQAAQLVAYNLGKGRVVITADGTLFSAQTVTLQDGGTFGLGMSRTDFDNRQLVLNIMHWLSGAIK